MRILVFSIDYPFPLAQGAHLRIYHYLSRLKGRHSFDLVCYDYEKRGEAPGPVKDLFENIYAFPVPEKRSAEGCWRGLKDRLSLRNWYMPPSQDIQEALKKLLNDTRYDVCWAMTRSFLNQMPQRDLPPRIIDVGDSVFLAGLRSLKTDHSLRAICSLIAGYLFDRRYLSGADACITVAEKDADFFHRTLRKTPIHVVHNGVDSEFFRPSGITQDATKIVFEGSLDFPPNDDGAQFFCEKIFPLILKVLPEASLMIVGKNPSPELLHFAGDNVQITGFVPDVRLHIDKAAVFVCPLRMGGGIKNKILQAWAMEKAVVATTPSIGGLKAEEGRNIIVRDNPKEFANAVVDLLQNPEKRKDLGKAGRQTVLTHYTWEQKACELEQLFLKVASKQ